MRFTKNTYIKLQLKINQIHEYLLFYQKYKDIFSTNKKDTIDKQTFKSMSHHSIYILYRSIFKKIENKIININDFTNDESIINAHTSLMNITDKDICHHDANSKSFVINDMLVEEGFLSDKQLEKIINFLYTKIAPKLV